MREVADLDSDVLKSLVVAASEVVADGAPCSTAIVGNSRTCDAVRRGLNSLGLANSIGPRVVTDVAGWEGRLSVLRSEAIKTIVLAVDAEKESVLRLIAAQTPYCPKVVVGGYHHLEFRDSVYQEALGALDEPSLANGYPNSRVHLFQCLQNAARLGLDGVVVEFGMFRGGTTQFLVEAIERLGQTWPVMGFDSFNGFPPRGHLFDLYDHPDLYDLSYDEVARRFAGQPVEIVAGDLRHTAGPALEGRPVVLAFVDTDNYTSGLAAIRAARDQVVIGGAIVLDHYTGVDRFVRTIGERMAARELLDDDDRYFNLHGTGVFTRQR